MTLLADGHDLRRRFGTYIDKFHQMFQENHIDDENWYANLKAAFDSSDFRTKWNSLWNEILEQEGGKLTLTVVLSIIGAAFGSIGIAGFGSAIGVPLALLAVPVGILSGNETDSSGLTKRFIRKARRCFSADISSDSPNDGADSIGEEFAVLLQLIEQTSERCVFLEEQNLELKGEIAALSGQSTQLKQRLETIHSELKHLNKHKTYLWCGLLTAIVLSVSALLYQLFR